MEGLAQPIRYTHAVHDAGAERSVSQAGESRLGEP